VDESVPGPGGPAAASLRKWLIPCLAILSAGEINAQTDGLRLRGQARVAEAPMTQGTALLHRTAVSAHGPVDSVAIGPDGSFVLKLPSAPEAESADLYFATILHDGVVYAGPALTTPGQLDSIYLIQAFDTASVAEAGIALPIVLRNVFLEDDGGPWHVTDLIQVRNNRARTLVSTPGGRVWSYPLPPRATQVTIGQESSVPAELDLTDGIISLRSPLQPGAHIFVARYVVPDPFLELPLPGRTGGLEVLIQAPGPLLEIPGLESRGTVEVEPGLTFRRFSGVGLEDQVLSFQPGEPAPSVPVGWWAALVALVLVGVGASMTLRARRPSSVVAAHSRRRELLVEIARLDQWFDEFSEPAEEDELDYARRRQELLGEVASLPQSGLARRTRPPRNRMTP